MARENPEAAKPSPKRVFISHIALETGLALLLKKWIEFSFKGRVEVFISETDITVGQFTREIEEALCRADVFVVLLSKFSKRSTWVFFEIGFAKAREVITVPIYLPNLGRVPQLLADLQALRLGLDNFSENLIKKVLPKALKISPPARFQRKRMNQAIRRYRRQFALMTKILRLLKGRDLAESTVRKLAEAAGTGTSIRATKEALNALESGSYASNDSIDGSDEFGYALDPRATAILELANQ